MAVYKVIQDVEAEDKILGPLSLKQLIFAAIALGTIFIAFRLVVATGLIYLAIPFLPIVFIFGVLAAPLGRDQPTEMWLAAQIRYFTKPRTRIWDQSDIKNLVNITAPKREEKIYTDGLNQQQVRSRLRALASTLDSRGWAVKNVDINMYAPNTYGQLESDRLIDPNSLPTAVSDIDIKASDDILDVANNETAHHFDELMQASGKAHKEALIAKMQRATQTTQNTPATAQSAPPQDYWFMQQQAAPEAAVGQAMFTEDVVQPAVPTTGQDSFIKAPEPELSAEEQAILDRAHQIKESTQSQYNSHHKMVLTPEQLQLLEKKKAQEEKEQKALEERKKQQAKKTHLSKADTIELANANLKISTLPSLATHKIQKQQDDSEVVINLR